MAQLFINTKYLGRNKSRILLQSINTLNTYNKINDNNLFNNKNQFLNRNYNSLGNGSPNRLDLNTNNNLPTIYKTKLSKELLFYIFGASCIVLSYFYWSYTTKGNSLNLKKVIEEHSSEIFNGAVANGFIVLGHPIHLNQLREVTGILDPGNKLKLQFCILLNPKDKLNNINEISERIMNNAINNSCMMNMETSYYIFPAVATVDEDKEKSDSEFLKLKEVSRKRKFMNRIVHIHCYYPISVEEAVDVNINKLISSQNQEEQNVQNLQDNQFNSNTSHQQNSDKPKIIAVHVVLSHMGDKMSPYISDFKVTEVNLVNVASLPWKNNWLRSDISENGWKNHKVNKINIERTVTPDGNFQFIDGISMYHKEYNYNIKHKI